MTTNVDNPFINPKIISYCTGFRGIERGIERAIGRTRTAVYVEIEAFIIENLLAGMETGQLVPAPIWSNIKTFDAAPFRDRIHGIIGGYPCQPFSLAGKRGGSDDPRHLWPYLERDIRTARPIWCFFENVRGHLSLGFKEVRQSLSEMGYAVEPGIFTAEEVGAPHKRERLFILAIRKDWLENSNNTRMRRGDNGNAQRHESKNKAKRPSVQLGNSTSINRRLPKPKELRKDFEVAGPSKKELGDTYNNDGFNVPGQNTQQEYNRLSNSSSKGIELANANANSSRSEQDTKPSKFWTSRFIKPPFNCRLAKQIKNNKRGFYRWPSIPVQPQHEWEETRTSGYIDRLPVSIRSMWSDSRKSFAKMLGAQIWEETDFRIKAHFESSMGSTIDGYNYREDLLRAYGNSVVEQTAELAFLTLLKKFGI